jgi:glycosyltransferase involved in cell wall biosynthesis
MKIIALFPVKNEAWILSTTIPQIKKFADEIICVDGGSTDGSVEILKSFGVKVKLQDEKNTNFSSWRRQLLEWGRELGGTHFLWIDADECPTTNFLKYYKEELTKMKPGEKICMQWLTLWKNPRFYRDDKSIWSNLYKDFIYCDDNISNFENALIHEGRTPGTNKGICRQISPEKGAVLHFQAVPFERYQVKQAFQKCRELDMKTSSARRINNKYAETLDNKNAILKQVQDAWIEGIYLPNTIQKEHRESYTDLIKSFFNKRGVEYFEPLQIWHIGELHKIFLEKMGREPKVKTYPKIMIKLNNLKNKIKQIIKNK